MSFEQSVLAWTGSVVTLSGVATVLDPGWTRDSSEKVKDAAETTRDRMVTNFLGVAMLGWGVGKLCVRRGYERAFMKLNVLPMLGSLAVAGRRVSPAAFWFQAVTATLYAVVGFKPRPAEGSPDMRLFGHLPERRVYRI